MVMVALLFCRGDILWLCSTNDYEKEPQRLLGATHSRASLPTIAKSSTFVGVVFFLKEPLR